MTAFTAPVGRGWGGRLFRLLLVLGILLLLVGYAGLDVWSGHRVDAEVARLEKQYGGLAEDTLRRPFVPARDNRARVVRAAASLVVREPDTVFSNAYNRFVTSAASPPVPIELKDFVEANRTALRVADDARRRGQSNWEVEYRYDGDRPSLLDMRSLSNAIYLASLMDLEAERPDDAAQTIATGLAVSASMRLENDLLVQLIRVSVGLQQLEAVHRLVIESEPPKASLDELATRLVENRSPDPARVGVISEMKHVNAALTRLENGRLAVNRGVSELLPLGFARFTRYESSVWLGVLARFERPFIRMARARYLRQVGDLLEWRGTPHPRPEFNSGAAPKQWVWLMQLDYLSSGLERSIDTFDRFNSALGATELAVALRRFRLDHGSYPDQLSSLVPAYLTGLPNDPFTGQPPVYARQGVGFQLHAQGGKNVPAAMASALDWTVSK